MTGIGSDWEGGVTLYFIPSSMLNINDSQNWTERVLELEGTDDKQNWSILLACLQRIVVGGN
jgi:hypothetical protein